MRTKTNSGSVVLKAAAIVLGACLTIIGMTSASGDLVTILKLAGAEGGFVSFAKTLDKLPPWYNTALALAGLLLNGGILNGVESSGRNHSSASAFSILLSGASSCPSAGSRPPANGHGWALTTT